MWHWLMMLGVSVWTQLRAPWPGGSQRAVGLQQGGESVRLWASSSRLLWRPVLQADERAPATQVDGDWVNSRSRLHDTQRRLGIRRSAVGNRHLGYISTLSVVRRILPICNLWRCIFLFCIASRKKRRPNHLLVSWWQSSSY